VVNDLAQQELGFRSNHEKIYFSRKKSDVLVCQTRQSSFRPMRGATICSTEPSSEKPYGPVFENEWSGISRTLDKTNKMTTTDLDDWRTPLVCYLENPGQVIEKSSANLLNMLCLIILFIAEL
jgi:hypothetical protein